MANYLAMNRDELTAEKAALEAKYKEFQAKIISEFRRVRDEIREKLQKFIQSLEV